MANKMVLYSCGFGFPMTLTLVHISVTWLGMWLLLRCQVYEAKPIPPRKCAMLAVSHISGIVLNNMSLHLNTVGFYQTSKV
jgi:solute carrier family 35 protein E3